MGWLDERILTHLYRHEDGTEEVLELAAAEEIPKIHNGAKFVETLPDQVNLVTRVAFERNGRKGYEIRGTGMKTRVVSATREAYEHRMGNMTAQQFKKAGRSVGDSIYSKDLQKQVDKQKLAAEKAAKRRK